VIKNLSENRLVVAGGGVAYGFRKDTDIMCFDV
jgi:hypothetical protein